MTKTVTLQPIEPMEARSVDELPADESWQFEPKWDGFRCIAVRSGDGVALFAKSGKPLGRYFPEVVAMIAGLPGDHFVLDGELVIATGGELSFDALQMRLHPAESRVRKLAADAPALFIAFDMLANAAGDLTASSLDLRRAALEAFVGAAKATGLRLSPFTRDRKQAVKWLEKVGGALDGVIAKRLDGPYLSGERAMLKVKRIRSADCVVGGFRYGTDSELVGSLLLGLFNDKGLLDHVGFTSGFSAAEKPDITQRLEALKGPPGFTGDAPGGSSRWSTERSSQWESLRHELVVEVLYDHVTGNRFRHGTKLHRWRPDKAPRQCTFEQLEPARKPEGVVANTIAGG
ncbi:MAG: dependent ligase [Devosia sp.]|uniref:ATP-dependent DNA ligase n=1 Tax=Devosia sp. TaxID=1871048 RepID=UPI00261F911A|nr:ATP-dependent DNA ligase [Devosia sp.]MDB5529329.1 dependent ligase [Devosia sp.]